MALTPSTMLPLGTVAPVFRLPDTEGNPVSLKNFAGARGLLVMFICNHGPYVKHVRLELAKLGRDYPPRGITLVAINANDAENFPEDRPEKMKEEVRSAGFVFPYLYDQTQFVARAYQAACTPDFFLFDQDRKLVYRGQLDDSRPGNGKPVAGRDLRGAMDSLIAGRPIATNQAPSVGCNIKWRRSN